MSNLQGRLCRHYLVGSFLCVLLSACSLTSAQSNVSNQSPVSNQQAEPSPTAEPNQVAVDQATPIVWTVNPKAPRTAANFWQLQAALDAADLLPARDAKRWLLLMIAPGIYREQVYLRRDQVALIGSGVERTVLQYPVLRRHFLALQTQPANSTRSANQTSANQLVATIPLPRGSALNKDWGAAVVNIKASHVALLDLTVHNSYAMENPDDPLRHDHQFAVRGFENASRIITDRARFASDGGDTMSLWNKTDGLYYHSRSYFSGRVDLFCPRGSALVVDSDFVNYKATATLWHDGELDPAQQLVVMRSNFHGVTGFELGRHHYDGQFILLGNTLSTALADQPIYRVTYPNEPWRNQPNRFGNRQVYRANLGPAYGWLADSRLDGASDDKARPAAEPGQYLVNLMQSQTPGALVFTGRWQPEAELAKLRLWQQQWQQASKAQGAFYD